MIAIVLLLAGTPAGAQTGSQQSFARYRACVERNALRLDDRNEPVRSIYDAAKDVCGKEYGVVIGDVTYETFNNPDIKSPNKSQIVSIAMDRLDQLLFGAVRLRLLEARSAARKR